MPASILFVCLGNICRSPLAEGAMRKEAGRRGLDLDIDSAGTGDWHVGELPDRRARQIADSNGVDISVQRARQVRCEDFSRYDHVVAMDASVLSALKRIRPAGASAELSLFLDHVPGREGEDVADPYYGGEDGFAVTWADVVAGADRLADKLGA